MAQEKNITVVIFSDNLRALMGATGTTQKALADAIGVSQPGVRNYLNGRIPNAVETLKIARYFGVSVEALLTDSKVAERAQKANQAKGKK